ncbi:MAG: type II secretion system minor pseudopilin GspK [Desulfobulbus sp.]|mgnify:FL=1|uniref:type II secretion system minor pseudopilin GspK n=1 Tax=uncultured Desulfobulbus sp. TaxID=239745 RepID=UPI001B6B8919|nr:type II secretion system minor pseudopilin GspK [uncultured Desulfobulbus sp.]MBP7517636.1 type II secretion system minor pseudopilin GspK [Desulfobulbus sp.]
MRTESIAGNQSGLALVLTLLFVSLLVAMTVQLMATIDRQSFGSAAQREQVRLDAMALGGLHLARAALLADQLENEVDSPHDRWAGLDPEKLQALAGGVDLQVGVTDLSGRLQVNALGASGATRNPGGSGQRAGHELEQYRQVWLRFLTSGRFAVADEEEAEGLIDALADWIDTDSRERLQGAEEGYYRALDPPHGCRNGPVRQIGELLRVRGMTPELLYGDSEREGIAAYITVAGEDGKINLNTAPLPVLQALSEEMTPELAGDLIDFRGDERNREALATVDWYKQVSGFPAGVTLDRTVLKVTGSFFEVTVRAASPPFVRTGVATLQRLDNRTQRLLSWTIE